MSHSLEMVIQPPGGLGWETPGSPWEEYTLKLKSVTLRQSGKNSEELTRL